MYAQPIIHIENMHSIRPSETSETLCIHMGGEMARRKWRIGRLETIHSRITMHLIPMELTSSYRPHHHRCCSCLARRFPSTASPPPPPLPPCLLIASASVPPPPPPQAMNPTPRPVESPLLSGRWSLIFTAGSGSPRRPAAAHRRRHHHRRRRTPSATLPPRGPSSGAAPRRADSRRAAQGGRRARRGACCSPRPTPSTPRCTGARARARA